MVKIECRHCAFPSSVAALTVTGGVALGSDTYCAAAKAGTLAYNSSSLQLCDGTNFSNVGGSSQWQTSGSNIYYAAGEVSVGTTAPVDDGTLITAISSQGQAIYAESDASGQSAIEGTSTAGGAGVEGVSTYSSGYGIEGWNTTSGYGVYGYSSSGWGVYGRSSNNGYGIYGYNQNAGYAVYGDNSAPLSGNGNGYGVYGTSAKGIGGYFTSATGYALITGTGNVGIGTTAPAGTLDVNGYVHLKKYLSAPATCGASLDGDIALTAVYTLCVCKSGTGWVTASTGSTSCTW